MNRLPDWSGEPCVVIASGLSAAVADLGLTRGRARHIAVNTSVQLCPWADILYAADYHWWRGYRDLVVAFGGLKVSIGNLADVHPDAVRLAYGHEHAFSAEPGIVSHMGNSGAQAVNVALLCGCKRIVLVGFDMRSRFGVHWHGSHRPGLKDPADDMLARWAKRLDAAAPSLALFGAEIVNASMASALTAYPKMRFAEAARWLTTPPARPSTPSTSAPTR